MPANRNLHIARNATFGFVFGDNKNVSMRKPLDFFEGGAF